MVAASDLPKINALNAELQIIDRAVANLDKGGKIGALWAPPPDTEIPAGPVWPPPELVPTGYMAFPPQMVESIKAQFAAHKQQIYDELGKLGVTVDTIERRAVPQAQVAPRTRTR